MSILLDALKRSESQRELGSVPTLQTNTESAAPAMQRATVWLPFGLVVIAAGLMTWLSLEQFRFEDTRLPAEMAQTQGEPTSVAERSSSAQVAPPATAANTPAAGESILPRLAESATAPSTDQAATGPQAAEQRQGRQVRDYTAEQAAAVNTQSTKPSEPTRDNAVRRDEVANVELSAPGYAPAIAPANAAVADDYEPDIINYWQVPEKMREGLPELRISVLVFAELPENRFVLMNGERLREGEELSNGLLLEEIQRDRAIFNYRNYRFYLKS